RRIALIRDVLERQREDRIEIRLGAQQEERLGPIPTLSADDLEKMLAILEQTAESMLPTQAVARQLDGVEGRARTLKLFAIMGRQDQRLITLLTDDLMQRLMEAISDEKARTMLETIPDRPQTAPMARKVKTVLTLWMNLDLAIE